MTRRPNWTQAHEIAHNTFAQDSKIQSIRILVTLGDVETTLEISRDGRTTEVL